MGVRSIVLGRKGGRRKRYMRSHLLEVLFFALIAAVALALVTAWRQLKRSRPFGENRTLYIPLVLTTASYLFFLLCWLFPQVLGPGYSTRRFAIIGVNCGLALTIFVISMLKKESRRPMVGMAALALELVWLIVGAISSAV